jgi:hypothetical protein
VHRYAGEHVPFEPLVTSNSALGLAYGYWFGNEPAVGGVASA